MLASVTGQLTSLIGNHGVYAVFLLMAIDAVFPAASEVVMLYAGALASGAFAGEQVVLFGKVIPSGFWAFVVMVLAGTLGYTLGAIGGWAIGDYGGRPYLERHGRWLHLSPAQLEKAERWFDRWDDKAVFLGRIVPIARSFISIPAGVFRMPLRPTPGSRSQARRSGVSRSPGSATRSGTTTRSSTRRCATSTTSSSWRWWRWSWSGSCGAGGSVQGRTAGSGKYPAAR